MTISLIRSNNKFQFLTRGLTTYEAQLARDRAEAAQIAAELAETNAQSSEDDAETAQAAAEAARDLAQAWASNAVAVTGQIPPFASVTSLLADTDLGYPSSGATYEIGTGVVIEAQGFRYEIADSAATDHDLTTAGGVKLYALALEGGRYSPSQFNAKGDLVADDTAAFNLATKAATAYASVEKRVIDLAGGRFRVTGTVYLRKGQTLQSGYLFMEATGQILLGFLSGGVTQDGGGAPVQVSKIWFEGGSNPIRSTVPGYMVTDCFFSSPASGCFFGGTDALVNNCVFDGGSTTLLTFVARNSLVSNCDFYLGNTQVSFGAGGLDSSLFSNCGFYYAALSSVSWTAGAAHAVQFNGCVFMKNAQDAGTFLGYVYTAGGASISGDLTFNSCHFRNGYNAAMRLDAATVSYKIDCNDCIFDGTKTYTSYTQSTTMYAVDMKTNGSSGCQLTMMNCKYRNLLAVPIQISSNLGFKLKIGGDSEFINNVGTQSISILASPSGAIVDLGNITGEGKDLISLAGSAQLRVSGPLKRWLTIRDDGTYSYVEVPVTGPSLIDATLIANPSPGGNGLYRAVENIMASSAIDFSGGALNTRVTLQEMFKGLSPTLGFNMDIQAAVDTIATGAAKAGNNYPGKVVIYWPTGYASESIDVHYKHIASKPL